MKKNRPLTAKQEQKLMAKAEKLKALGFKVKRADRWLWITSTSKQDKRTCGLLAIKEGCRWATNRKQFMFSFDKNNFGSSLDTKSLMKKYHAKIV